ncbi:MAG TPA: alpha/beta family hydrolase [Burkholderiaceae bacterium]|nr:alpha/beta family hydrolase [Burkholderiaceae bacterium]
MPARPATTWQIDIDGEAISAAFEPATAESTGTLYICAHGAGGHMADKAMLAATAALRSTGLDVVRFNFVYREKGLNRPDPMPRLEACVAAVTEHARAIVQPKRVILGGRSMGGRAASMLAAKGYACDGLLLLAYPLHPAEQPEKLRDGHLPKVAVPVLCFNGTRDTLCRQDLMLKTLEHLSALWTMHWLDGADHSFHVLKSSGRTDRDVLDEVAAATRAWLASRVMAEA